MRERDIDGLQSAGEQKLVKQGECEREGYRERETRKERVNTSYCWNTVATRCRKGGGGVCACVCACVQRSVGFLSSVKSRRCAEVRVGNLQ